MRGSSLVVTVAMVVAGASAGCGDNNKPPPQQQPPPPPGTAPVEVTCRTLPPTSGGTCDVSPGSKALLLEGTVLTETTVYKGGQVAVDEAGMITCVGCDCSNAGATRISCPDAAISPGLINTHDHITFTQNDPYDDTGVRYEHRHQWRNGLDGRAEIPSPLTNSTDQILWGELRFLMGGATSIVGSGGRNGFVRNLDFAVDGEANGLPREVSFETFPLGDGDGQRGVDLRRRHDCTYPSPFTTADLGEVDSFEPHTAEGIDTDARNEFLCQSSASYDVVAPGVSYDLLSDKTAMIHGIGLDAEDYNAMAATGTGLIWSPRSNITLYGETARVTTAARVGVEIALGTDWMPTGSMNLLRELACADSFNANYLDRYFRDDELWKMVTVNAAKLTLNDDVVGALAPGKIADIAIFASRGRPPFRSVIEAEPEDVTLVVRHGKVLYGDDALVSAVATDCDTIDVCGTGKRLCAMSEINKTYMALEAGAMPIYRAFSCELPPDEPTCVPSRPISVAGSTVYTGTRSETDDDGDGIVDGDDDCPTVFNPIRPIDNGVQPDADGDGSGDACDPCPFDAATTECSGSAREDRDHDEVAGTADNCLEAYNPDQADGDGDGKGNACDLCPTDANPGTVGCPRSIYQVNGDMPRSFPVRLTNVLVTGRGSNGFFVQVKQSDGNWNGADRAGLFVFTNNNTDAARALLAKASVGARVTIDGSKGNFQGQTQLDNVINVEIVSVGPEPPPTPVMVSYAEIKTNEPRAAALDGVLVTVGLADVTNVDTANQEFTLSDAATPPNRLIVDDFVAADLVRTQDPQTDQSFATATGILARRQNASKLLPRGTADLVFAPPKLRALGPALSFARAGLTTDAPTFPSTAPLTITLTNPAQGDTPVVLTSSAAALTVPAMVVVPNGAQTAVVPVTATAQATEVTVTGTLVNRRDARVRVLAADEVPTTLTLTPAVTSIAPNGTASFTVALDLPALTPIMVTLTADPADAGTLPSSVEISVDKISATINYVDTTAMSPVTITASATFAGGPRTATASVTINRGVNHLVISQIYGGGGNSGAPLNSDFIELFNPTAAPISLAGLSVQYASSTGMSWNNLTVLPDVMLMPGRYFLIQEASGANGQPLPTPDVAMGMIAMAAGNGKVALVRSTSSLPNGPCPLEDPNVIDFVGYGTADCAEGGMAVPALSNTRAALRPGNSCKDTDNNRADFDVVAPAPRNSATAAATCQ